MALTAPGEHRCHLPGCETPTPRQFLFCKKHWFMVSRVTRIRVWRAYRGAGGTDGCIARATPEWVAAVKQAEVEVLEAERKIRERREEENPFH